VITVKPCQKFHKLRLLIIIGVIVLRLITIPTANTAMITGKLSVEMTAFGDLAQGYGSVISPNSK
jgi:hypothetical protein